MGYDVHITRKDDWSDADGPAITRAEWFHTVARDPSLQLVRDVIVENGQGEQISLHEDTLTVWRDWPGRAEGRAEALFWHSGGNVFAKNPDRATRAKMHAIAGTLKAKVQGDDGETYDAEGQVKLTRSEGRAWWKLW